MQLELEGGAPVCGRPLRVDVEPGRLSEISRVKHGTGSASAGICADRILRSIIRESGWARRTQHVSTPLSENMPLLPLQPDELEPRHSSPTRPTFRPMLICGASGAERRGGGDGTGEQPQRRHHHCFPAATVRSTHRTPNRDPGQLPGPRLVKHLAMPSGFVSPHPT